MLDIMRNIVLQRKKKHRQSAIGEIMNKDIKKIRELLTHLHFDYNSSNLTMEQFKIIEQISDIAHKMKYDKINLNENKVIEDKEDIEQNILESITDPKNFKNSIVKYQSDIVVARNKYCNTLMHYLSNESFIDFPNFEKRKTIVKRELDTLFTLCMARFMEKYKED